MTGAELIQAKSGELNVVYEGRALYSRYAPSASADRAAARAEFLENCIYVVPSPLLEYGISSLIEHIPSSSFVLGLESNEILNEIRNDSSIRNSRYTSCFAKDTTGLYRIFSSLQKGQYRRLILLPLNGAYSVNKELYDVFFATLQHFMKNYWQNRLTTAHMGGLWIKNLCSNLGFLGSRDISTFSTGLPVVLCGAGESLEDSLPLLQEVRGSIYLLAVDTAVQPLIRFGLVPDGIVNLEAQFYNLKDFYSVIECPVDLFSDISAYPGSLRFPAHRHFFFSSSFGDTMLQTRIREAGLLPTEIPPLGSVGVAALYIASQISTAPLFFTGLDFAYIQGKTHARETPFHDLATLKNSRLTGNWWYSFSVGRKAYAVEGKSPEATLSNTILESYGRQLEDICRSLNRPVYDLGSKGLKMNIPCIDHRVFKDFLEGYEQENQKEEESRENRTEKSREISRTVIETECAKLNSILSLWDELSRGERQEEEILPLLRDCDYLYFHFPDRETLPSVNHAFLFRVIGEARELLRRLTLSAST